MVNNAKIYKFPKLSCPREKGILALKKYKEMEEVSLAEFVRI
jgi:hypothetical protein